MKASAVVARRDDIDPGVAQTPWVGRTWRGGQRRPRWRDRSRRPAARRPPGADPSTDRPLRRRTPRTSATPRGGSSTKSGRLTGRPGGAGPAPRRSRRRAGRRRSRDVGRLPVQATSGAGGTGRGTAGGGRRARRPIAISASGGPPSGTSPPPSRAATRSRAKRSASEVASGSNETDVRQAGVIEDDDD